MSDKPLENPEVVRLLARIASEARHGVNCGETRLSCLRILEIIGEHADEYIAELCKLKGN